MDTDDEFLSAVSSDEDVLQDSDNDLSGVEGKNGSTWFSLAFESY